MNQTEIHLNRKSNRKKQPEKNNRKKQPENLVLDEIPVYFKRLAGMSIRLIRTLDEFLVECPLALAVGSQET